MKRLNSLGTFSCNDSVEKSPPYRPRGVWEQHSPIKAACHWGGIIRTSQLSRYTWKVPHPRMINYIVAYEYVHSLLIHQRKSNPSKLRIPFLRKSELGRGTRRGVNTLQRSCNGNGGLRVLGRSTARGARPLDYIRLFGIEQALWKEGAYKTG